MDEVRLLQKVKPAFTKPAFGATLTSLLLISSAVLVLVVTVGDRDFIVALSVLSASRSAIAILLRSYLAALFVSSFVNESKM